MISRALSLLALAASAAAQPMTNPAIFGRGGTDLGGIVAGTLIGGLAFFGLKNIADEVRWRTGKPVLEKMLLSAGAVIGLAIFGVCVFVL